MSLLGKLVRKYTKMANSALNGRHRRNVQSVCKPVVICYIHLFASAPSMIASISRPFLFGVPMKSRPLEIILRSCNGV